MNILIPDSWLREYIDTKATPKQLKDCLSLCGPSIERINNVEGDAVYDIEITSNRVDMASVYGIAREASAILPRFNIQAVLKTWQEAEIETHKNNSLPLIIKDENNLTNRLLAVVMDNVTVQSAPKFISERIEKCGIRSLNNLVDITNYVMMELGHPSHVFDYDRIKTNTFIIRNAKNSEKIVTLDKKEYRLSEEDIIIDDGTGRVIDLPGIMGTENSVVTKDTKRIIFFIESNNPVAIRKSSMRYGIRTMAASINEKHPDPHLAETALHRGIELYRDTAGARLRSDVIDIFPHQAKPKTVTVTPGFINQRLGVELTEKEIIEILNSLTFLVNVKSAKNPENSKEFPQDNTLLITPPTFRQFDITIPEDIVEEVARLYGYHNLPGILMDGQIPITDTSHRLQQEENVKTMLKYWGYTEAYTYSFVSREVIEKAGLQVLDHLKLKNPLTEEIEYMRTSLLPSMLQTIENNQPHRDSLSFFEMSNVYIPRKGELPEEKMVLMIASTHGFASVKGVVEAICREIGLKNYNVREFTHGYFHPQKSAAFSNDNTQFAILGIVHPTLISAFEIKKEIAIAAIHIDEMIQLASPAKQFTPISLYPAAHEELTIRIQPQTHIGEILDSINQSDKRIIHSDLTDTYNDAVTFKITYHDRTKTITSEEVQEIRKTVLKNLKDKFNAELKTT